MLTTARKLLVTSKIPHQNNIVFASHLYNLLSPENETFFYSQAALASIFSKKEISQNASCDTPGHEWPRVSKAVFMLWILLSPFRIKMCLPCTHSKNTWQLKYLSVKGCWNVITQLAPGPLSDATAGMVKDKLRCYQADTLLNNKGGNRAT